MRNKWNRFLYALCVLVLVGSFLPDVRVWAADLGELSYTDGWGNVFIYTIDDDGNAVIKGITLSGSELMIPESIGGVPVIAVDRGDNSCVINNPETEIPRLYVNCASIGVGAFRGIIAGELEIGPDVAELEVSTRGGVEHHWEQFAGCRVEKVTYGALGLSISSPNPNTGSTYYGPFYEAVVGGLEFSPGVTLIPENLFRDSCLQVDTLTIDVDKIGGYAFAGESVSIGELVLGEGAGQFMEFSDSDIVTHYWDQFKGATVGKLCLNTTRLELQHALAVSQKSTLCGPFNRAHIGALEIREDVEYIAEAMLKDAVMSADDFVVSAPEIGAFAFASENISFGTLTIAEGVTTFAESYYSYASPHYWSQFQGCKIDSLVYLAESAVSSNDFLVWTSPVFYGPFYQAEIGTLKIGEAVQKIPDYFLNGAKITLETFVLDAEEIGAMSFVGDDVVIRHLTIGKNVERFALSANSNTGGQYWRQFYGQHFDTVRFEAVESEVVGLLSNASSFSGPFVNATIGTLSIGDEVRVIPRYCFFKAVINQEELYVNVNTIGPSAFRGSDISIGTLGIGPDVEYFTPLVYGVSNSFRQFGETTIGTLRYEAVEAETAESCAAGSFEGASVGGVVFGDGVKSIPNYLLYHANADLEELDINVPTVGFYSFSGSNVVIGKLTIGEDVGSFPINTSNYNRAFYESSIGSLYYNADSAVVTGTTKNSYGPFAGGAVLDKVVIGGNVVFLDSRLFRGNTIADCVVYPVAASAEYLTQTWNNAYLPAVTKLYIHHNSKFASYFTYQVEEADWMCKECFELTYGERTLDEDTGEYLVQVIRHCPVCGYNEVSTEALDDSYSLYLCIPLEVALVYVSEDKAFEGSAEFYVYGTLGNAYAGVRLTVDTDGEGYGTAVLDGTAIDIALFLVTGFDSGDKAVFTAAEVAENTEAIADGEDAPNVDVLNVSVSGYAFYLSGPGNYRIPLPLVVELY